MYSNVYYRLDFPEAKQQFIYAPLDPFNPKTRSIEQQALDVGLRQHDMIQNRMLQNVGLFDGSLINGNVFDEVKDSDAKGFLASDYFRKFIVEFIADYRKTKQIKTTEDRKALIVKLTEELNRGLQPNEVEILDQALMGINIGPSPQPVQAPVQAPVQVPPIQAPQQQQQPPVIRQAPPTPATVLETDQQYYDNVAKIQKEIIDLFDNGEERKSYEREIDLKNYMIERIKKTTNDPVEIKKLEDERDGVIQKIAKLGQPPTRDVRVEVGKLMQDNFRPNPARITIRIEGKKYMIDKLIVDPEVDKLVFSTDAGGKLLDVPNPTEDLLKLFCINDNTVLEKLSIGKKDFEDYIDILKQLGIPITGTSKKVKWLKTKNITGMGLKRRAKKSPVKKPAKKPTKKAKSTASINHYKNPKELITRMKILVGEQRGGNNSPDVVNEIAEIADELLKGDVISKSEHRVIYSKYVL